MILISQITYVSQQIDIPSVQLTKPEKRTFRPITQAGRNTFFDSIQNVSWDFISNFSLNINDVANTFNNIIKVAYEYSS